MEAREKIPLEPGDIVVRWMDLNAWRASPRNRERYEWRVEGYDPDRQMAYVRQGEEVRLLPVRMLAYVGRAD